MPDIKEIKSIFDVTPIDQAILLVGIHGVGKSEFIAEHFGEKGYGIITLFLGQMADAGDLIGLPDRTVVDFQYGGEKIQQKITEFAPPKWWPRTDDAKIVIFLDEFNRGKQEVYQCIFDMVLNRKLNGLDLPKETRVIAAMNPSGDDYDYDVVELGPALVDRFNVYQFFPTSEEWIHWASKAKLHNYVIGFINKNRSYLDPYDVKGQAGGQGKVRRTEDVYPSRRSWKRVSDILLQNEGIINDMELLRTVINGIVGVGATSKFSTYIKETVKKISAGRVVTRWSEEVEKEIKTLSHQEMIHMNQEMILYLNGEEKTLFEASSANEADMYAYNVERYLRCLPKEIVAEFYRQLTTAHQNGSTWAKKVLTVNPKMVDWFIDIMHGEQEEATSQIDPDDHFKSPGLDDLI